MRILCSFLCVVFFVSCSGTKNNYKIEKEALVSFSTATFQKWDAPVKGGDSGLNITLVAQNTNEEVQIQGIFFREGYAALKAQGNGKFQGFINTGANDKANEESVQGSEEKKETIETIVEEFPFTLEANEAVVSFFHKGKLKYNKITLQKKKQSLQDVPR